MPSPVGHPPLIVCVWARSAIETSFERLLYFVVGEGTVNPGWLTAPSPHCGRANSMEPPLSK